MAHFLIDECQVDIIHGHSAHHLQGIEIRNGKVILYGCGDALGTICILHPVVIYFILVLLQMIMQSMEHLGTILLRYFRFRFQWIYLVTI